MEYEPITTISVNQHEVPIYDPPYRGCGSPWIDLFELMCALTSKERAVGLLRKVHDYIDPDAIITHRNGEMITTTVSIWVAQDLFDLLSPKEAAQGERALVDAVKFWQAKEEQLDCQP